LIEWRKKNSPPKALWKRVSYGLINLFSEDLSCQYAYGKSACHKFFLLRTYARYHKRRAEPWFAKTVFEPIKYVPVEDFKTLIVPVSGYYERR